MNSLPPRLSSSSIIERLRASVRNVVEAIRKLLRQGVTPRLEELGLRQVESDDELYLQFAIRTADWVLMACFGARIVVVPLTLISVLPQIASLSGTYAVAVVLLITWNVLLIIAVSKPQRRGQLNGNPFFTIDLSLTVSVNLWAAGILHHGQVLLPNHDIFWEYAAGTVAVWTVLRGVRVGLLLLPGGACLECLMIILNRGVISDSGLSTEISRFCWLATAVPVPAIIMGLARQGAGLGSAEGRRAGRALERVRSLRMIHDTVLQTLAQIAQRAVATEFPVSERARQIRELAMGQRVELEHALLADDSNAVGLVDGLQGLTRQFAAQGIVANLIASEIVADPPPVVTEALLGAAREALTNVRKHANVDNVTVRAVTTGKGHRMVIRDHGCGFDSAAMHSGLGIRESIRRRLAEVGGEAQIWSEPGRGTRIELAVDFGAARRAAGRRLAPHAAISVGSERSTSVDALTEQALAWLAVAALAYRAIISPIQSVTLFASLNPGRASLFMMGVAVMFAFDIALLAALLFGRYPKLFRSPVLVAVDLSLLAGINFWSAFVLPAGTVLAPMHEGLWIYTLGAVALWTALRGPAAGAAIVAGGFLLQVAMAKANHTPLSAAAWIPITTQEAVTFAAFAVSWLVTALVRRGAQEAVSEGIEAGLSIEHAWVLRDLYSQALNSLSAIIDRASTAVSLQEIMGIRGAALDEVDRLRPAIDRDRQSSRTNFADDLRQMTSSFQNHGLRVELVTSQLISDPPDAAADCLLSASREALKSVADHAAVPHVVLRASNVNDGFEITVRDHGAGLPAQEEASADVIRHHMANVGGDAEISSEPGRGTRIRIRWKPTESGSEG